MVLVPKNVSKNWGAKFNYAQRAGLAAVLEFIMSSAELKPNKITDDEDKNKSRLELRLPKPLLIANKKMRIYSSASVAPNRMLAVRAFRREVIARISPPSSFLNL